MKRATRLILAIIFFYSSTLSSNVSGQSFQPYPPQYGKPFTGVPDKRDVNMYQVNTRSSEIMISGLPSPSRSSILALPLLKSILGKVYLTTHDFVKAEAKLQEVTTLGYALLPKYNDLFDYTKNEHHAEYIFDIEYEEGINEGSIFTTQFSLSFQGGGTLASIMASYYGLPAAGGGDQGCPTDQLFAAYDSSDLRKGITAAKGLTVNGVYTPISTTGIGSFTLKYMVPMIKANDSKANWKVVRYADVILMYAEALNENGKTTEALTWLNKVRTRAGVANYSGLNQDDTREKIYLERRLELTMEGHRWFDLVRTGRAFTTMSPLGMKSYMTIFPVPQAQVEIIHDASIFPQNPGYN